VVQRCCSVVYVPEEDRESFLKLDDDSILRKTLRLAWDPDKIFLQKMFCEKLSWDKSLAHALYPEWKNICSFAMTQRAEFPRWSLLSPVDVEIHGFCDTIIKVRVFMSC